VRGYGLAAEISPEVTAPGVSLPSSLQDARTSCKRSQMLRYVKMTR
jgi:hypothetical protein